MAKIWYDVNITLAEIPIAENGIVSSTDFITLATALTSTAAWDLSWHRVTTTGGYTRTAVTPTATTASHGLINQGDGNYTVALPSSGGTVDNDTEGFGWWQGRLSGYLPFKGPTVGFRAAGLNNALIDTGTALSSHSAADVWGSSVRTLTASPFSTANTDSVEAAVWGSSARTLTVDPLSTGNIDNITADIWGASARTLTAGVTLTTAAEDSAVVKVWDRVLTGVTHNIANSAGRRLRQIDAAFEVHSGTAQTGSTNTITIDTGGSTIDNIYRGDRIVITEGTGAQEHNICVSYDGGTFVATMAEDWVVTPDATSVFQIVPASVDVETWQHNAVTGDGDWATLSTEVNQTLADTNELQQDDIPGVLAAQNDIGSTEVKDQVVAGLNTDTYAEPGQGAPAATASIATKVGHLYKNYRNEKRQTATQWSLYDDAGTTVDQKATVSGDGTLVTKNEIISGP